MTDNPTVEYIRNYATKYLKDELPGDFLYHNFAHTYSVVDYCSQFCVALDIAQEEQEDLEIAAWLHDMGYLTTYEQHEAASVKLAEELLRERQYPEERINRIRRLIMATIPTRQPSDVLEMIIKDADLNNLGSEAFIELGENLRHEWNKFLGREYNQLEWYRNSMAFLKGHQYFTEPARVRFGHQKKDNQKKVKKLIKNLEGGEKGNEKKKKEKISPIASSRNAQMMFKTALRNHIDLTNIADNKANMMLSINAIVITITMPLLADKLDETRFLIVPTSLLLLTCVLSIIFAALVTRPIKMTGITDLAKVSTGNTNLFFFGNFYNMSNKDYHLGLEEVLESEALLENTIKNDLYYLGKALGKKYNRLRICYVIFMVGMTSSVLAFALAFTFFT